MGTSDSKDPPSTDTPKEGNSEAINGTLKEETPAAIVAPVLSLPAPVVNLYEQKAARMGDAVLMSECMMYLHMLENNKLSPDHKHRAMILFKTASERKAFEAMRDDFLIALRVLRHL